MDEDFNAKLSDFGLATQGPAAGIDHVSTSVSFSLFLGHNYYLFVILYGPKYKIDDHRSVLISCTSVNDATLIFLLNYFLQVVGTVGYAAPEYIHAGRLTTKSDVWSLGVVLYELITGRRVLERNLPRGEQKLLEWVRPYVSDPKKFHLILDQRLEGQFCMNSAQKLASLANKCLMKHPRSRPKMSEIIEMLGGMINEASLPDKSGPRDIKHIENVEEETAESKSGKCENSIRRKGFDFLEIVSRNRSIGKLDWTNWTTSLSRT